MNKCISKDLEYLRLMLKRYLFKEIENLNTEVVKN